MTVFFQRCREAVADAGSAQPGLLESDPCRVRATLRLTPHGKLVFEDQGDAPDLDARIALRLREAFARGSGEGLWRLGAGEAGEILPPVFVWWRDFAARFVTALRRRPRELDEPVGEAVTAGSEPPTPAELASLALTAPLMAGAEYLTLDAAFAHGSGANSGSGAYSRQISPAMELTQHVEH